MRIEQTRGKGNADRHEPVEILVQPAAPQPDQGSALAKVKRAGWDAILLKPPLPPNAIACAGTFVRLIR